MFAGVAEPLRVLFASANCLLDATNGAALTMQSLLQGLVEQGLQVRTLQGCCFDTPRGADPLQLPTLPAGMTRLVRRTRNDLNHDILVGSHRSRITQPLLYDQDFELAFLQLIEGFRPHVLLSWGGYHLERALRREARVRGVASVFYLANPTYAVKDAIRIFRDVDHILTDSAATSTYFRRRLGLVSNPVGLFIDDQRVVASSRAPAFVTFVAPVLEKGVSLVAGLARLCLQQLPEARFLVVESRGSWNACLESFGLCAADLPNVETRPLQTDMREIYSQSKVVLMPSFWHESGGMVALEALMNGIPVLASDHGGLPETLGSGAIYFQIPAAVRSSKAIPDDQLLMPWLAALRLLWRDQAAYQSAADRAVAAGAHYSRSAGIDRVVSLLHSIGGRTTGTSRS